MHISLFFDGTGNNLNDDLYKSDTPHPTNIARLFRATVGDGHAGGTTHSEGASRLTDAAGTGNGQYFKYYMPGVGTPFAEVGDLDYTISGLGGAWFGEKRINWGLLMLIDALRRTLGLPRLDNASLKTAVGAMGTVLGTEWAMGRSNRSVEFRKQLKAIEKPLSLALKQPNPGTSKLLGIKLYVYGFSRGAAAARAFVSWLNELMHYRSFLKLGDLELPLSVEYLGLLDTVASVGIADIMPGADGHMAWADGNQELPGGRLVKRCLHLAASFEQRLCFPLESIRRESGGYPVNSVEVIYPGVHSDLGGGYPPGDQGKAIGENDGLLLSQIALNDLYTDAFAHGAPMKVPKDCLPLGLRHELWRAMEADVERAFAIAPILVNRFNAWRQMTLGLPPVSQPLSTEQIERYQPLTSTTTLEHAVRAQLGWITAWRIDRYAFASLKQTAFYRQATDTQADATVREEAKDTRDKAQKLIEKNRREQLAHERNSRLPKEPLQPGVKDFDADMAQTQLREAAEDFAAAYRDPDHLASSLSRVLPANAGTVVVLRIITADARVECRQMKAAGRARVRQLFPPPPGYTNHPDDKTRGPVDESANATQPAGLLRALFDDQVHDSRAWFLYKFGREPMGSYFRERMVFFGEASRRELALNHEAKAELLAAGMPLPTSESVVAAQPPVMDAPRMAETQQAIEAHWDAFYAQIGEVKDASA
ncbi:T6SS phospholipase effector Tle1-like catalytic domain-containing protein [Pseudomonas frederiksbergensis]|uniref:T6SS phospholipase effector Tle1-like catalytic domain-containing protein n=1 Tax=Pseudomonas frederiksbergensis TaxID=104087 RepID=UPI003D085ED4